MYLLIIDSSETLFLTLFLLVVENIVNMIVLLQIIWYHLFVMTFSFEWLISLTLSVSANPKSGVNISLTPNVKWLHCNTNTSVKPTANASVDSEC